MMPPPDPAFTQWCADHPKELELCARVHEVATGNQDWINNVAVVLFVLATMTLIWWVRVYSRDAYIGGQFIQECGGYEGAVRVLERLKADNEALLAGGVSAAVFLKPKRTKE